MLISNLDRFPKIKTSDNYIVLTFPLNLLLKHPKKSRIIANSQEIDLWGNFSGDDDDDDDDDDNVNDDDQP